MRAYNNSGNNKKKFGNTNSKYYKGKHSKNKINSIDAYLEFEQLENENFIKNQNIQKKSNFKTFDIPEEHKNEKIKNRFISHKNLNEIINKDDNQIIQFFMKYDDLPSVINNTKFNSEMIYLMTEIMLKIAFVNSGPATIILKQIIENTNFVERDIKNSLENIDIDDKKGLYFLLNLIKFSDKLLDKFSNNYKRIRPGDLYDIENMLLYIMKQNEENEYKELIINIIENINHFKERENQINIISRLKEKEEKRKEGKNDIKDSDKIPIDYKSAELILKSEDFYEKYNKAIAPHIKVGPYFSYERYINTNFYLEREDCYRSIRNAINILQSNGKSINNMNYNEVKMITKKFSDIYYYINGEINYIEVNSYGVIITLDFLGVNSKRIKFTKRMITGSLIILTDNDYTDYLLTTVFYNPYFDLKENGGNKNDKNKLKIKIPKEPYYRVQLSLININPQSFLFLIQNRKNLQIFESKAYFESYIHIMKRLQQLNVKDLPFKSELIDGNFENIKLFQPKNGYTYKNLQIYADKEFPTQFKDLLDDSQLEASKLTLSNKIAIVQGPPGTGKTHFGTIMNDIIYQNLNNELNEKFEEDSKIEDEEDNYENNNPPQILIVCYTNHALDQIIEKIANYTNNIVRIGGRCRNEKVKRFEFHKRNFSKNYSKIVGNLNKLGKKMKTITSLIDVRRRVSTLKVEKEFNNLYRKVIEDFFLLVRQSISFKHYNKLNITPKIEKKIYIFWNMIGNEKDYLSEIIYLLLDNLDLSQKEIDHLFHQIYKQFTGYNKDNLEVLKFINNYNNEYIDGNHINFNEIVEDKDEEEEEEECDEEEILENEDKLKYMADNIGNIDDYFNYINNAKKSEEQEEQEQEEEEEELLDENDIEFRKINPLNEEKFNFLINSKNINFFKLGPKIIKLFIDYMKNQLLLKSINNQFEFEEFNELLNLKNEISLTEDAEIIKNYKIVCMTTTGCAKYSTILEQLNFETILIEEAAEVKESHVISLLTKNTKRLILIGDHKQLQPKPYNYEIATKYNFNVSLFERLINNKIPYSSLKYQRRMKTKFADFVRIIYGGQDYIDFEDVNNKEEVKGIKNDMYFITHHQFETENIGLKSRENNYEANYISKLCRYLLLQNYNPEQITILTFYIGQVFLIRKYLKKYEIKNVKVSSIDNYQGEENDIILLSLVRSNAKNEIGFLRNFNRVCVAFSRAKLGFYIIGDIDGIVKGEEKLKNKSKKYKVDEKIQDIWSKIKKKAEELKIIGNELVLECQNHKKQTIIRKIEDFENCPEGGCQEPCRKRMKCGHVCEKLCHVYNCNDQKCFKSCYKLFSPCGHPCKKLCYEDCGKCQVLVEKKLPCGHIKKKCKCSENEYFIKCNEKCERKLSCGHDCKLKCYENCESIACKVMVEKILPCGHKNKVECGKKSYELICQEICQKDLECGHKCKGTCGECLEGTLHIKCESICGKVLPCGHPCNQKCSSECICEKKCENICPHGYCDDECYDICVECKEKCDIGCKHKKCKKRCGELCDREPCNKRCKKKLKCGHQCYGLCGEKCPNACRKCNPNMECFIKDFFYLSELDENELIYETYCGHIFSVEGLDNHFKSNRKIQMIACPQCTKSLIWEPRYQNYIKNLFTDIQKVKQITLDRNFLKNGETFFSKSQKIVNRILKQFGEEDEKEKKIIMKIYIIEELKDKE